MNNPFKYSNRAVAFLDVLGFKEKLDEFENEAISFYEDLANGDDDEGEQGVLTGYFSEKANEFIDAFESAISKLDEDKFSYYLFSDNICITANNSRSSDPNSLSELLLVICELYFEFIQKGYFLRGGIDFGLFIDQSSIALGKPLANAYLIETNVAVFPRIVLSSNFIKQFEVYTSEGVEYNSVLSEFLIKKSCEIHYLNVFTYLFKIENKEGFFGDYSERIKSSLEQNFKKEHIYLKYVWLAREFNSFLDDYINEMAFLDENFDPTAEYLAEIENYRIDYE